MDIKFGDVDDRIANIKLDAVDETFTEVDTKLDGIDTEVKTQLRQVKEGGYFTLQIFL